MISIHALLAESDRLKIPCVKLSIISIHALLAESDHQEEKKGLYLSLISIHALLAESDTVLTLICPVIAISIHALLAESDNILRVVSVQIRRFLSTLSLRRATVWVKADPFGIFISIHALLAESDPATESDAQTAGKFLSTLSLRRATPQRRAPPKQPGNFYPRSPCGERPRQILVLGQTPKHFYPRSPCGERRLLIQPAVIKRRSHFYPRSPCGERRWTCPALCRPAIFLSTLSLRRATRTAFEACTMDGISIHALLAESDRWVRRRHKQAIDFYPRSPCGERRSARSSLRMAGYFYPRSPCGERLGNYDRWTMKTSISIHALLAESDEAQTLAQEYVDKFLSTLSLRRATGLDFEH